MLLQELIFIYCKVVQGDTRDFLTVVISLKISKQIKEVLPFFLYLLKGIKEEKRNN